MRIREHLAALLRRIATGLALASFGASPALADPQSLPTPLAPVLREVPPAPLKPALWMVSDEDTTIYLFGTIHALRPGLPWFEGPVAQAFAESGTLVTEIADVGTMDTAQSLLGNAMLPPGETLRGKLSDTERAIFDAALQRASIPAASLDRFKPWYAAVVLSSLPLMRAGYQIDQGVEIQLATRARASGKSQEALETAAYQLGLFDSLPEASQLAYLKQVVENLDSLTAQIDSLIVDWGEGDADGLAAQMNADKSDPALVEALLSRRNKAWAEWIDERLETPGTVFLAVGAGHLAGSGSVQEVLSAKGIASQRLQ